MSDLGEAEIFSTMIEHFRIAADASDRLAVDDRKGPAYSTLRDALAMIEGCCRQASAWRGDTRWLMVGQMMHAVHERSGSMLRGFKDQTTGVRVTYAAVEKNEAFVMLSANLRNLMKVAQDFRHNATKTTGLILPAAVDHGRRQGAPVPVSLPQRLRAKGLILPASAR